MLLERQRCRTKAHNCAKASASSPEAATPPQPSTPDTTSDRNSIGFLLNCPGDTDFLQEFPKSSTLSPNSKAEDGYSSISTTKPEFAPITTIPPAPAGPYQEYGHMIQANNLDVFLSHLEFQTFETQTNNWQMPGENMMLWSGRDALFIDRSVLEQKAFDIKEKLRFTAASQTPGHLPSPELLQAIEVINANNIAAYIKLYFRHWHKHGPMVHEATFNPCTAAIPLVLALMSLGGMVSRQKSFGDDWLAG